MRWAENIKINGEIFAEYAFLTYKIKYSGQKDFGADSFFKLPPNSLLSGFKLFCGERLIEPELVSAKWVATIRDDSDKSFAKLNKLKEDEYLLSVDSTQDITVMMSVYAKLSGGRLILPFSRSEYEEKKSSLSVDLRIECDGEVFSPTHKMQIIKEDCQKVTLDCCGTLRDICIEIKDAEKVNRGIATEGILDGEMLCCLYSNIKPDYKPEKLLIFLDNYASEHPLFFVAKEMAYYLAKNCGVKYSVVCGKETDGDFDFFENKDKGVMDFLNSVSGTAESIKPPEKPKDKDCMMVCVSANPNVDFEAYPNVVTVGERAVSENMHIFPYDDLESRAKEILKLLYDGKNYVCLTPSYGEATILKCDGELFAYVKYPGDIPPKKFTVTVNGESEEVSLSDIRIYRSFAPIGLVKGKHICDGLQKKLAVCEDYEVSEIREKIEEAGLKYSFLNSETTLIAELDGKKVKIKTVFPIYQSERAYSEFNNRPLMFRENNEPPSQRFAEICRDILIKSMRSDGSICADGETEHRKKQTLISVLALVAYKKPSEKFLRKAESFLAGYSLNGAGFTDDKEKAFLHLGRFVDEKSYIPDGEVPNLFAAATVLYQVVEICKKQRQE